jgi:hypothetical protein
LIDALRSAEIFRRAASVSRVRKSITGAAMQKITVYYFTMYDIRADEVVQSKRPATLESVVRFGGTILEDTGEDVDPVELDAHGLLKI